MYWQYYLRDEDRSIPKSLQKRIQKEVFGQYKSFFGRPLVQVSYTRDLLWPSVEGRPGTYRLVK